MSRRVYQFILYAYPSRLRTEFGSDMMSLFEQQLIDARREGGFWQVCRVWAWALWESSEAFASMAVAYGSIGALSILSSSALFLLFFWVAGFANRCVK